MKKNTIVLVTAVLFVVIFVVAGSLYSNQKNKEISASSMANMESMQRDYSPTMGPPDAKVTIVEFFDPACGTCSAFYPLVKKLMRAHPGKVNLVLRYLPLHAGSDVVVSMFEAARLQGRFRLALELAYKTQSTWVEHHVSKPEKLWAAFGELGLNMDKLYVDMQSAEIDKRIKQDVSDAKRLNVRRTPGFFVNGKPLVDFGYEQLKQLVESEVSANYK